MDGFASQIERVTVAIRPLADEMNKVAAGFTLFLQESKDLSPRTRDCLHLIRGQVSLWCNGHGDKPVESKTGSPLFCTA